MIYTMTVIGSLTFVLFLITAIAVMEERMDKDDDKSEDISERINRMYEKLHRKN